MSGLGKLEGAQRTGDAAVQRRPLRRVFLGPYGLRAGWGCLLFLVLLVSLSWGINLLLHWLLHTPRLQPGAPVPPRRLILGEFGSAAAVLFISFVMMRVESRTFAGVGLRDRAFLPRMAGGLVSGFAAISVLVGVLWASHLLVLSGVVLPRRAALGYGSAWALGFLLVGLFEELLLRGYLLFTLARGMGWLWSSLLLSAAFGAIHGTNKGETPVGLFSAAAVGLLFCLSIWYTRSLWWAIGFHAAWDWGESFFWSTSDSGLLVQGHLLNERPAGSPLLSGGATGPEGSVLVFPLLLLCALLVSLWWRRTARAPAAGSGQRG